MDEEGLITDQSELPQIIVIIIIIIFIVIMIRWMLDEDGWLIGVNFHDGAVVASYPWDHYTVIMTIMVIAHYKMIMVIAHYKMIMMILHYTVIMTIMVIMTICI